MIHDERIERFRDVIAEATGLWMDIYGDSDYGNIGCASTPFLIEVEHEYFRTLKFRYPEHFQGSIPDSTIRRLVKGDLPEKGIRVIYVHLGVDREVLYVGQTRHFLARQKQHELTSIWWDEIEAIEFLSPVESLNDVERACIKILAPRYNIMLNRGNRER